MILSPCGAEGAVSASWLTVKGWPATVSVAVRADVVTFAATVRFSVPGPVPPDGEIVTQAAAPVADQVQPTGVVMLTDPLPPAAAMLNDVRLSVYVHVAAACVTRNVRPPMVRFPVRDVDAGFCCQANVIVAGPVPTLGEAVSQLALLVTVHVQPASVVTFTDPLPPAEPTFWDVRLSVYVHVAAACVTVNVRPPIVRVAVRLEGAVFAAAVKLTDPDPVPLAGDTVTHVALLEAVHAHPASEVRPTLPVPPAAATL
jgi:hypothetical protein